MSTTCVLRSTHTHKQQIAASESSATHNNCLYTNNWLIKKARSTVRIALPSVCRVPAGCVNDNMTVANRFENGYGLGVRQPLQGCAVHGQDLISCVANKRRCMTMYGDENINMEISVF